MSKIFKYPDPILKKKAEEVKEITPEIRDLIEKMKEIVKGDEVTVGLAAPQLGVSKRIIIVQTEKGLAAFVNPEIIEKTKDTETAEEGCLSLPGIFLNIKRWKGIRVKALDEHGEDVEIRADGFIARVFQQEIDHINGALIIDRLGWFQRFKIRKKLKNLK